MKKLQHLDLFSGYGGFALGLRDYVQTVGFAEIDKYASGVLAFNFNGIKNYGNVCDIDFRQFRGKIDIITGGTPCQDLSVAGKHKGLNGERSGLFFEFIRAITQSKPKYFIWENVKGALSSNRGWDFAKIQIEMAQAGYNVQWAILNAKDFGVPQNRNRVFVLGVRGECPPEVLHLGEDSEKTPHELTSGLSQGYRVYSTNGVAITQNSRGGGLGAKTGLYFIDMCVGKGGITKYSRTIPRKYNKGFGQYSDTSGVLVQGTTSRIRKFTPLETERLMGLPDNWTAKGIIDGKEVEISDTQRYIMCGNGVVIPVVEFIATHWLKGLT